MEDSSSDSEMKCDFYIYFCTDEGIWNSLHHCVKIHIIWGQTATLVYWADAGITEDTALVHHSSPAFCAGAQWRP